MLTQSLLKEHLLYNQNTGIFTRLKSNSRWKSGDVAGYLTAHGYITITVCGTKYYAHRLAWLYMTSYWPKNTIDHIDRVKTNNAFNNLRDVNYFVQNINKPPRKNLCGFQGVYKNKSGKFVAVCRINKERKHIGVFLTPNEAHIAYLSFINENSIEMALRVS